MKTLVRLVVGLLVAAAVGVGTASPASAATLVVDDDGQGTAGSCNATTPTHSTIQAAVTAASPGDTIRVCPGVYTENVSVGKTLTLLGAKDGVHGKRRSGTTTDESIVQAASTSLPTFSLGADTIILDGFAIRNGSPGVYTSPSFSGYAIRNNVVFDNVFGIYANSSGTLATTINRNNIKDNNTTGPANGTGILSDQGLANARITDNVLTGHNMTAINFGSFGSGAPAVHDVEVVTNRFENNPGNSIVLLDAQRIGVRRNTMLRSGGSALLLNEAFIPVSVVESIDIVANTIRNGGNNGISVSIGADDVLITDNIVRQNATRGLNVSSAEAAATRTFENSFSDNGTDGIFYSSATNGNTINDNIARSNGDFDCEDDSTGSGTAGTANTWVKNEGVTSDPPGLCVP